MKLALITLALAILACRVNVPLTATPSITAQPTAAETLAVLRPERMVQRVTPTARPINQCAVTADVLTVRTCGSVECAAIDWLKQGEVITASSTITGWVWIGQGWINSVYCKEIK